MPPDTEGTNVTARAGLNGRTPRCDHIDTPPTARPARSVCKECLTQGRTWTRLLTCLACGWVACDDDLRRGHATGHYQETNHPVAAALGPGSTWRWCFVPNRTV